MDLRVRMVLLGLVLGVVFAVFFAMQGCGENHPRKQSPAHAVAPMGATAVAQALRAV